MPVDDEREIIGIIRFYSIFLVRCPELEFTMQRVLGHGRLLEGLPPASPGLSLSEATVRRNLH
jgi:hypothetical protein